MPVSFAGLDLSFMKRNPLPKQAPKERIDHRAKRSDLPAPYFVSDIKPFIANATPETVEITSRSQLRAYERANGIKQCGDYKPGQIVAEQNKRVSEATYVSPEDQKAADFKWID